MRGLRKTDIPVSVGGVIGDGIFTLISCSLACFCYICTKRKGAFACCGESRVRVRHTPDIRCGIRAQAGGFPSGQGAFPITDHPTNENDPVACRAAGRDGRPSRSGRRLGRRDRRPTRCASGASKRPMPCSADYWPHTTIHGRPCPVSVFLSYAMHRAVTTVAAVAFCLPGSIWPILRRGRCVGAR